MRYTKKRQSTCRQVIVISFIHLVKSTPEFGENCGRFRSLASNKPPPSFFVFATEVLWHTLCRARCFFEVPNGVVPERDATTNLCGSVDRAA